MSAEQIVLFMPPKYMLYSDLFRAIRIYLRYRRDDSALSTSCGFCKQTLRCPANYSTERELDLRHFRCGKLLIKIDLKTNFF